MAKPAAKKPAAKKPTAKKASTGEPATSAAAAAATELPSILVVDIAGANFLPGIEQGLAPYLGEEAGHAFSQIGARSYALSRAVYRRLRAAKGTPSALSHVANLPGVVRAYLEEADTVVDAMQAKLHEVQPAAAPDKVKTGWNLARVNAAAAWDMFKGGLAAAPWSHMRIAQLDTGYTPHACFGFDKNGEPTPATWMRADLGLNLFDGAGRPLDPLPKSGTPGHGTRIGSVICGIDGKRITGVAPRVTVVPYRITDFVVIGTGSTPNLVAPALRHAVRHAACDVVNISLGDPCLPGREMGRAIDEAYLEGILVCCAAGNITSEVTYPGRYRRTLTAGGLAKPGKKPWAGSSRGQRVDLVAPADEIFRAQAPAGYGDEDADGTSYATAHLSGAAALWLAYHGKAIEQRYGRTWRRVEAFRQVVRASAHRPADWARYEKDFGAGILDVAALLKAKLPNPDDLRMIETPAEGEVV